MFSSTLTNLPHPTSTATAPTNDDSTSHADPLKSLEDLAVEYRDLCQKETELQLLMDRLEGEEESLSTALTQVEPAPARTTATKRSTGSQPISQQRQAMQRLEEALMQDDSTSAGSSSDDDEDE